MKTKIQEKTDTGGKAVTVEVLPSLTVAQREERDRYEQDVRRHVESYFEAAFALKYLHDKGLYLEEYSSWEGYVSAKLGLDRTYAHRLMKGADYIENVLRPLGLALPQNESQIRPLTVLPKEKAQKAWREVVKKAKNSKITTSLVVQVVARYHPLEPSHKNGSVSSVQTEIAKLLSEAIQAVEHADFETAAHHVNLAQVRIDVEAGKARRSSDTEE